MKYFFSILLSLVSATVMAQNLVINELQVANIDRYLDPSCNYGSWFELYNPTDADISLENLIVRHTDGDGVVEQQKLSAAIHGKVPAKGYKVLWCDHKAGTGTYDGALGKVNYTNADGTVVQIGNSVQQMSFKLDPDGGKLEILKSNTVLATITYGEDACIARCSWARTTDGGDTWSMTATPTPGRTNNGNNYASERLDAPVINTDGSIFESSVSCQVTIPDGQTLIYTTDGSAPSIISGTLADGTIHGTKSTDGQFSFTETTILRFALFEDGKLPSQVVTCSFIKKDYEYYLPILSVSGNPDVFFNDTLGVISDGTNGVVGNNSTNIPYNWNMEWERPSNMELFEPNDLTYEKKLNQENEFQLAGGWSRGSAPWISEGWKRRPPFRLESSKLYEGKNSLDYPYLQSKQYNKYKSILVRNGGSTTSAVATTRMREATTQEIIRRSGMYLDNQAWQPTHVFINGKYYGTMNIREVSNKNYPYSNYGIDKNEMDQWEGFFDMKEGTSDCGINWLNYSKALASNPNETNWRRIESLLEIDEINNYLASEIYMGSDDWIVNTIDKNIKGFRAHSDGKIHLNVYDLDNAFKVDSLILCIMHGNTPTGSVLHSNYITILRNMFNYSPYKQQFVDTYCMMAGSVFEENRSKAIEEEMLNYVTKAISFEDNAKPTRYNSKRMAGKEARIKNLQTALSLGDEYKVKISSNIEDAKLLLNGQEIPTNKFDGSLFGTISLTAKAPAGYIFRGWRMNTHTGAKKETSAKTSPKSSPKARTSLKSTSASTSTGSTESYNSDDEIGIFDEIASTSESYTLTDEYEAGTFVLEAVYHKITDNETRIADGATPIRINEVSAGNDIYINDYFKKQDWVELYNTTDEDIDVAGMYLSDDQSNPRKYQIQAMTTDPNSLPTPQTTVIPAHGTRIIWCDDLTQKNQLHAPFKLSNADGAVVSIMAEDGSWEDVMEYKYQPRFFTYGRYPDGGNYACLMSRPTIDATNSILTQDFRAATQKKWASPDIAITLGLFKGWNWTSHNFADAVQTSLIMPNALCIRDQEKESIKDDIYGWVGNISTLEPAVGYKLKMSENTAVTLRGNIFDNTNTPVTIQEGWNWIGMPLYSPCTPKAFFCNYEASEGDIIQGQEGFSTYSDGAWQGSLTALTPGQAYLLKAGKAQQTYWNCVKNSGGSTEGYGEGDLDWTGDDSKGGSTEGYTTSNMDWGDTVSTFGASTESNGGNSNSKKMTEQYGSSNLEWDDNGETTSRKETNRRYMCPLAATESAGLWTCDIHAYPNVMSLIGELQIDDRIVSAGYTVAAFNDDECRGVADVAHGRIYLNLHGEDSEELTFKVCDADGEVYALDDVMVFTPQSLVGSNDAPYIFNLSTITDLSAADANTVVSTEYYTLNGIRIASPDNNEVYIKKVTYKDGHVKTVKMK